MRKQRRLNQDSAVDPVEIRVRKFKQAPIRRKDAPPPAPQQAILLTKRPPVPKKETGILPALARRQRSFGASSSVEKVVQIDTKVKVLPAIPKGWLFLIII